MAGGEAAGPHDESPAPPGDWGIGAAALLLLGGALALDAVGPPGSWAGLAYVVPYVIVVAGLPRVPPLVAAAVAILASAAGLLLSPPGLAAAGAVAAGGASWAVLAGLPAALALVGRASSWLLIAGTAVAIDRYRPGPGGAVPRDDPYRVLVREHDAAVLVIDPVDGAIVDANAAAARFFWASPDELRAMRITDPGAGPGGAAGPRLLLGRHGPVRCVLRHASGEERYVEVVILPVAAGERALLYATVFDVTEAHRAGEAVRENGARAGSLLERLPGGVVIFGADAGTGGPADDLRVTGLNAAGERLFGRRREEAIGRTARDLLGEAWPSRSAAFVRVLETGRPELIAMDGPADERFELRLYRPAPGQVAALAIDVTARSRAEEDLRLSCAHLEESVRLAGSDLREPLWTIVSFTELVLRSTGDRLDPEDREVLEYVRGAGRRLEDRIDALVRDVRIEGRPVFLEPVDLGDVLAAARDEPGVDPDAVTTDGPLPVVLADRSLLAEALAELVPAGGEAAPRAVVSAEREDGGWRVRIAGGRGTGIGTAARIVERHGGSLRVEHGPGGGTTVSFTLPLADGPAGSDPAAHHPE